MMTTRVKTALGAAFLSFAALGPAGPARAAIYTGNWDPGYGEPFPDLGWKASATFDVPEACLGQADGSYPISGNCAGFEVLSAQLDFYNFANDPNPDTSPLVQSFALNPGVFVNGVDIGGGRMTGIDTLFFDSVVPSAEGALPIAGNGAFSFSLIFFGGNQAQLVYASPVTVSPICASIPGNETRCGFSQNAAVGVFAPAVPEPGAYALMLAGLAAVGFAARRRAR